MCLAWKSFSLECLHCRHCTERAWKQVQSGTMRILILAVTATILAGVSAQQATPSVVPLRTGWQLASSAAVTIGGSKVNPIYFKVFHQSDSTKNVTIEMLLIDNLTVKSCFFYTVSIVLERGLHPCISYAYCSTENAHVLGLVVVKPVLRQSHSHSQQQSCMP